MRLTSAADRRGERTVNFTERLAEGETLQPNCSVSAGQMSRQKRGAEDGIDAAAMTQRRAQWKLEIGLFTFGETRPDEGTFTTRGYYRFIISS